MDKIQEIYNKIIKDDIEKINENFLSKIKNSIKKRVQERKDMKDASDDCYKYTIDIMDILTDDKIDYSRKTNNLLKLRDQIYTKTKVQNPKVKKEYLDVISILDETIREIRSAE
jgi:CRISPR/Cas system Type II protein with McrA/HNH and RuvC-like nuclease domain